MTEKEFTPGTVLCPCCEARTFYRDAPWKMLCVSCYLEARNPGKRRSTEPVPVASPAGAGAGIEPAMLRRLIQLCHPDKHQRSEAATVATRYLLALREARP